MDGACPYCSREMSLQANGILWCPVCDEYFYLDDSGRITEVGLLVKDEEGE